MTVKDLIAREKWALENFRPDKPMDMTCPGPWFPEIKATSKRANISNKSKGST